MEPLKYDGESDVRDYLLQFAIIAKTNGWDREERGRRLAGLLIGDAREVLGTLGSKQAHHYRGLVTALIKRYSPEGQEGRYCIMP